MAAGESSIEERPRSVTVDALGLADAMGKWESCLLKRWMPYATAELMMAAASASRRVGFMAGRVFQGLSLMTNEGFSRTIRGNLWMINSFNFARLRPRR